MQILRERISWSASFWISLLALAGNFEEFTFYLRRLTWKNFPCFYTVYYGFLLKFPIRKGGRGREGEGESEHVVNLFVVQYRERSEAGSGERERKAETESQRETLVSCNVVQRGERLQEDAQLTIRERRERDTQRERERVSSILLSFRTENKVERRSSR